jgi:hypothetical protein
MAKENEAKPAAAPADTSDADKARARQWFKKAADCRERREYDYAIECFITGLGYWPEAVEEGHMPLRSLAIQRAQAGGKKPGMMDTYKRPMTGKDLKQALLNAEHLLSMDPTNGNFAEAALKNAVKGGLLEAAKCLTPFATEPLKKEKKPNKARFKALRDLLIEASNKSEGSGQETWFLEQAVNLLEFLIMRLPGEDELRNEQRDLAGKLTISRGKYEQAGDFRDSLHDAEGQKLLHDADRARQGEETLEALIAATRRNWEKEPGSPGRLKAYIDALLKEERQDHEDEAIAVLTREYERTRNYSSKLAADDIRLRQLQRQARVLVQRAKQTGSDDDRQQARLAALEQRQTLLEVYRERVVQYPTDLRLKYVLGRALFEAEEYDEAIPLLQAGQGDPRSRNRCQYFIGRAFLAKGSPGQAAAVLQETLEHYELTDDFSKELLYWLARAYEAAGSVAEAKDAFGRLLRQDYNYMNGDARVRLDKLNQGNGSGS